MLIEANPIEYEHLIINRPNAININGAAYNYNGIIDFVQNEGIVHILI